jgi:UDP-N-acetylglucosamine 2-epimerase (non-hydrolysing)
VSCRLMSKTILSVVGARPNFLKVAPLHQEFLKHRDRLQSLIVHTGQHYDAEMSEAFFRDLELPKADFYLEAGSASHSVQTARVMTRFEEVLQCARPDCVVVFGDVNSTLACALVCAKEHVPLAHVEAGLRSFDRRMPEEINRLLTDQVSDWLFVTEQAGVENLLREGIAPDRIHLTGNIMIDALIQFEAKADRSSILQTLHIQPRNYFVMTLHRASNVDSREILAQLVRLIVSIGSLSPLVFPVHPRTARRLEEFGLLNELKSAPGIQLTEPLGYLDFLCLTKNARGVISDSGGVQAETTHLNVPCLTLRQETEQPVTVELGTNALIGLHPEGVLEWVDAACNGNNKKAQPIPCWDGRTAERITEVLLKH